MGSTLERDAHGSSGEDEELTDADNEINVALKQNAKLLGLDFSLPLQPFRVADGASSRLSNQDNRNESNQNGSPQSFSEPEGNFVKSLGRDYPVGLPYLVTEGFLRYPAHPSQYTRHTYRVKEASGSGYVEDEILSTSKVVVWSRGDYVQKSYRFEDENEPVKHALLTRFSEDTVPKYSKKRKQKRPAGSPDNTSPEPSLNVRKKRGGTSKDDETETVKADHPPLSTQEAAKPTTDSGTLGEAGVALVVILKTQAHVYFLEGASHLIPLPFDVSGAFAMPSGLILQRAPLHKAPIASSPVVPFTPYPSFAMSHLSNPSFLHQSSSPPTNQPPLIEDMLKLTLGPKKGMREKDSPSLFYLADPLLEFSVVTEPTPEVSKAKARLVFPNPEETLLYVSSEQLNDISLSKRPDPILLAVTYNENTSQYSLWRVIPIKSPKMLHSQKSTSTYDNDDLRRRSSFAPGTGATTPTVRASMGGRESFGGQFPDAAAAPPKDRTVSGNIPPRNDDEIASQLDPAFENPGAQPRSSRRISSLLARSELSSNRDASNLGDLTAGQHQGGNIKRGPSFGHTKRKSFASRGNRRTTSASIAETDGDLMSESENSGDSEDEETAPKRGSLGTQTEVQFSKIFSFQAGHPVQRPAGEEPLPSKRPDTEVFCVAPPSFAAVEKEHVGYRALCIIDRQSRRLSMLRIAISRGHGRNDRSAKRVKVLDVKSHGGVLDACEITDGTSSRIMLLEETNDGQGRLSVQSPWMKGKEITVPARLRSWNPYTDDAWFWEMKDFESRSKHTGKSKKPKDRKNWKRILRKEASKLGGHKDTSPVRFKKSEKTRKRAEDTEMSGLAEPSKSKSKQLRHSNAGSALDESSTDDATDDNEDPASHVSSIETKDTSIRFLFNSSVYHQCIFGDSLGKMHRLELKLRPQNHLVHSAITICQFALPAGNEQEPLLRAWWDVLPWIRERTTFSEDLEWIAFIVTIFAMFVGDLKSQRGGRQSKARRKAHLLNTNEGLGDAFKDMMADQAASGALTSHWMQEPHWQTILASAEIDISQPGRPQARAEVSPLKKRFGLLQECVELAQEWSKTQEGSSALGDSGYLPTAQSADSETRQMALTKTLLALHLLREELKLDVLAIAQLQALAPVLAQLGGWLDWEDWGWKPESFYMLEGAEMEEWIFNESLNATSAGVEQPIPPPSILEHVEDLINGAQGVSFPSIEVISAVTRSQASISAALRQLTPRTTIVLGLLKFQDSGPSSFIRIIGDSQLDMDILETLPEGVAAPLRSAIAACQSNPGTSLPLRVLQLIGRTDISMLNDPDIGPLVTSSFQEIGSHEAVRDYHSICSSAFEAGPATAYDGSAEMDRQAVTRMIFKEDQRFAEAAKLVHPLRPAVAKCYPEPEWNDADLLEAQQELAKIIAVRTLSVSPGRAMLFYNARVPLITERFPIHGFSLSCVMKPSNTTVTADKTIYTEEKVSWAFFHAGVEAGLSISRHASGIDTSWIIYNKPPELNNRHAGFLLALGLNGHLKSIAKWVAFKYLTPKHTMTSIGLLLGLAASYLGTMDTLITRLLSVHVTRMLPPGAAELNLSPLTQTTGIMAIGLLYCDTQHRRMSEIMLSEMENIEQEDAAAPMDSLRDESYRLAAGFALGFINLGQGKKLKGLRDMRIVERLLSLAVATKRVDIVHLLDKATAAATVAIALIFMKTGDELLARKVDIPDTVHQFEYVRPDLFLLRTLARHLILWDKIAPTFDWIREQLPPPLRGESKFRQYMYLQSEQLPLFNIIAGLCLAIGLRFAGTGRTDVRDLLGYYLDSFIKIVSIPGNSYDEKLTRITARNCQDVVALAAAAVMAGTGDIFLFRRFRIMHGRTDADTGYGSHLACHQAIGVLFLGGGTHTFNTSNLAVASLLCAFYPLFPMSVLDNKSHLQAFRHFWVLAAEPRCLVVRGVDSKRPLSMPISIHLRSGAELRTTAPCLLPELHTVARVTTQDPGYWPVTLDFAQNPDHLAAFRRHQSIFVRPLVGPQPPQLQQQRWSGQEAAAAATAAAGRSVFSTTLQALNDAQTARMLGKRGPEWIWAVPSLRAFDHAARALLAPPEGAGLATGSEAGNLLRVTSVDDRLVLAGVVSSGRAADEAVVGGGRAERLWNLRVLFAWADKVRRMGGSMGWLGREIVDGLRAEVALRASEGAGISEDR